MAVLVGKQAPDFTAKAAVGSEVKDGFTLSQFKGKKYVVLFFYPLDFTFVCPTELHAFQEALGEFNQRNAQVVGCSIDSVNSHLAWLNTSKKDGGIQGVTLPHRRRPHQANLARVRRARRGRRDHLPRYLHHRQERHRHGAEHQPPAHRS